MSSNTIPVTLKTDLRSPALPSLRRGITLKWLRVFTLILVDTGALSLAWWLASRLGTPLFSPWHVSSNPTFLPLILLVGVGIIGTRGLYRAGGCRRDYLGLLKSISLAQVILLLIAFLHEPINTVSRSTFLLSWLFSLLFVAVGRLMVDTATNSVRSHGAIRYPVFLISEPESQKQQMDLISHENCYSLVGVEDARSLDRGRREQTLATLRRLNVVEAFVSWGAIQNRLHLCWHFQRAGITLRILPDQWNSYFPKTEFHLLGDVPAPTVRVPMIVGSDYWIKRIFDFCCAATAIVLFSPLYVLIALFIKLDSPGPIFFRQVRVGLQGREFRVWKFRTMVADADKLQAKLEAQNEMKDGVLFKMKEDPRITDIGAFLRRYSLDELPQLFNVLLGEMSFVGPRPLPLRDVERFREQYFIRQEVLPGITGLWQVSGRSNIDNFEDAINLDLSYIANWSLGMDLGIMLQTVQVVLQRKGAY